MAQALIRGVYAITRDESDTEKLIADVDAALTGGIRLVQYRNKSASSKLAREQAVALRALTRAANATLIVNDDIDLALAISADGVHLGRHDGNAPGNFSELRQRSLGQFLIGLSCYNDLALARSASDAGADYVAFGSFFPSTTKPDAIHVETTVMREAKRLLSLPVVAIGGITLENAPQLLAAGANSVAVISSLFDADDIVKRAGLFSSLFPEHVREQPKTI